MFYRVKRGAKKMSENMTRDTTPFISVTNNNNDHFVMCDDKNIRNKLVTLL